MTIKETGKPPFKGRIRLHLAKQNFKFSAAHFLILDAENAERLHGHNYRVRLELKLFSEPADWIQAKGYSIDFHKIKRVVKDILDAWDERVLLPKQHPEMRFLVKDNSLHVHFRERFYVFPKDEVILIDANNSSVENFSQLLCEKIWARLELQYEELGGERSEFERLVETLRVDVEETDGQSASCERQSQLQESNQTTYQGKQNG